ncbi:hypothetical protein [Endozoicomonas lisbonensis]|uniref:hypothetical protein n=1 Tax=Endozoicomonas lisbonensis TaxID=3120522 RepID=UPI003390E838
MDALVDAKAVEAAIAQEIATGRSLSFIITLVLFASLENMAGLSPTGIQATN